MIHALSNAGQLQALGLEKLYIYIIRASRHYIYISPFKVLEFGYAGENLLSWATLQFARSMTGHRSRTSIKRFWQHCVGLEEWAHHPCLQNPETYDCAMLQFILFVVIKTCVVSIFLAISCRCPKQFVLFVFLTLQGSCVS